MERIFGASSAVSGVCSASSGKNQPAVEAVQDFSAAVQKATDASGETAQLSQDEQARTKEELSKAIKKSILQAGIRMAQEAAAKARETFNA
jgi:hypothetical protein